MRKNNGITLVEIIIIVALALTILLGLVIPVVVFYIYKDTSIYDIPVWVWYLFLRR